MKTITGDQVQQGCAWLTSLTILIVVTRWRYYKPQYNQTPLIIWQQWTPVVLYSRRLNPFWCCVRELYHAATALPSSHAALCFQCQPSVPWVVTDCSVVRGRPYLCTGPVHCGTDVWGTKHTQTHTDGVLDWSRMFGVSIRYYLHKYQLKCVIVDTVFPFLASHKNNDCYWYYKLYTSRI